MGTLFEPGENIARLIFSHTFSAAQDLGALKKI